MRAYRIHTHTHTSRARIEIKDEPKKQLSVVLFSLFFNVDSINRYDDFFFRSLTHPYFVVVAISGLQYI